MDYLKLIKQIEDEANKISSMIAEKVSRGEKLVMLFKEDFSPFSNGQRVITKYATKQEIETRQYVI